MLLEWRGSGERSDSGSTTFYMCYAFSLERQTAVRLLACLPRNLVLLPAGRDDDVAIDVAPDDACPAYVSRGVRSTEHSR